MFHKIKTKIIRDLAKEIALFINNPLAEPPKRKNKSEVKVWISRDYEIDYWNKIQQAQKENEFLYPIEKK